MHKYRIYLKIFTNFETPELSNGSLQFLPTYYVLKYLNTCKRNWFEQIDFINYWNHKNSDEVNKNSLTDLNMH